jgi:hypothetical protein
MNGSYNPQRPAISDPAGAVTATKTTQKALAFCCEPSVVALG